MHIGCRTLTQICWWWYLPGPRWSQTNQCHQGNQEGRPRHWRPRSPSWLRWSHHHQTQRWILRVHSAGTHWLYHQWCQHWRCIHQACSSKNINATTCIQGLTQILWLWLQLQLLFCYWKTQLSRSNNKRRHPFCHSPNCQVFIRS